MCIDLIQDIPLFKDWVDIEMPQDGASRNIKYHIKDKNNKTLLLRVSDIKYLDEKKNEYENIIRLSEIDITMPKPIEFGTCNGGKHLYMLLTWIDGVAVQDVIKDLDSDLQYELGFLAGKALQKIHFNSKVGFCN